MKKNKIFIAVLSLSMLTSTMYLARLVTAVEFEGKESEYMNIC